MPSSSVRRGADAAAFRELYDRYARQVHGYHLRARATRTRRTT